MSTLLCETTSIPEATSKPGRWKAVLITPGKGSSANYSEAALRESGPKALRRGAKSFVTHNRTENGEPDPFKMWGFLAEDARYEDGVGLVGEIEVLPSFRDRIAEVAPHTALSVYVNGTVDNDGNLVEFTEDAQNGVDLVVYPGRPGSGLVEKLYESFRAPEGAPNGTAADQPQGTEKKGILMEKEEFKTLFAEFKTELIAGLAEALKPAAEEPKDVLDLPVIAEAVRELPEDMRKEIYTAVEGKTQTEALALVQARKDLVESITKQINESAKPKAPEFGTGRVTGEQGSGEKFSMKKIGEKA